MAVDFNLSLLRRNRLEWIGPGNGIDLSQGGQAITTSKPEGFYRQLRSGQGLTLEACAAANNRLQRGPGEILSYSADIYLKNFALGQYQKKLYFMLRTPNTDLNGCEPHLLVDDIFLSSEPQHIVVTYDFSEVSLYINNVRRVRTTLPGGQFTNWDPSYLFFLGNGPRGDAPWRGRLLLVAIYNRALSKEEVRENFLKGSLDACLTDGKSQRDKKGLIALYLFNEERGRVINDHSESASPLRLQIPSRIVNKRPYLSWRCSSLPNCLRDIVLNVLAFIPMGLGGHALVKKRFTSSVVATVCVAVGGLVFSLASSACRVCWPLGSRQWWMLPPIPLERC